MTGVSMSLALALTSALWSIAAPAQTPAGSVPAPLAAAVDPTSLQRYVGTYKSDIWIAKVAVAKNGQLTLQINGLDPVKLVAVTEGQFRPEGMKGISLVFHSDTAGISHFILNREGNEIRADRKRPKPRTA